MRTHKLLAGAACIVLAISLSACGPNNNGNRKDDDDDGGWFPVFIPWSQPHQTNNYYQRDNRAPIIPAPRPPVYRAPAVRPAPMTRTK